MVRKFVICMVIASVFGIISAFSPVVTKDVKAEGSYADLLQRIEALEQAPTGNVSAPKVRGLKIGGSIRHRFEIQSDFLGIIGGANSGGETEDFTLQRVRLFFDADVNKNVRGYIKLQDVRTWGIEEAVAGNGTVGNLGRVDLLEGYVELRNLGDLSSALDNINVRIGRWQWFYGDHRLIGHLNWANEGRSYDGIRVRYDNKKNAWIDIFAAQIDEFDTGSDAASGEEDGRGNQDEVLWGFYSQFKVTPGIAIEPYTIVRYRSRDVDGDDGASSQPGEQRYTSGFRIAGKKIPWLSGFDFTLEQAWQYGDTEPSSGASDQDIDAFAGAWGGGYTFNCPWSPRIGYNFVYATGDDDPTDGDNETFDHLYPTGHARLGYMDAHGWQNIEDHQIHFSVKPTKKLLMKADFHFFDAEEEIDAMYSVVGGVSALGNTSSATAAYDDDYGEELDITVKYKLFKNFGVVAGYSHYWVGDYIEDARAAGVRPSTGNKSKDADWFYLSTVLKF